MNRFFEKVVTTASGAIKLGTLDTFSHMNVIMKNSDGDIRQTMTLSAEQAVMLRDALNEAYPCEPQADSEYKVEADDFPGTYNVYRDVPTTKREYVAMDLTEQNAWKIAKALNETEGL